MSTEERLEKLYQSYQFLIDKHMELKGMYKNLQTENVRLIRRNEALVNQNELTRYIVFLEKKLASKYISFNPDKLIVGHWVKHEVYEKSQKEVDYWKQKAQVYKQKLDEFHIKENCEEQSKVYISY
jgi:hypothetical protein